MTPALRVTARVVPVNPTGEVLLLQDRDPAEPDALRWGTVGGAVDEGESLAEAAVRELREETGIEASTRDLTVAFHRDRHVFSLNRRLYLGDSTFFALRLDRDVEVSFDHLEPAEVGNVLAARWWHPRDLAEDRQARVVTPDLCRTLTKAVRAVLGGES